MNLFLQLLPLAGLLLGLSKASAQYSGPYSTITATTTITHTISSHSQMPDKVVTITGPTQTIINTIGAPMPQPQPQQPSTHSDHYTLSCKFKGLYIKYDIRGKIYDQAKFRDGNGLKDAIKKYIDLWSFNFEYDSDSGQWDYHASGHAKIAFNCAGIGLGICEAGGCPSYF